jgi:hypothetical protein
METLRVTAYAALDKMVRVCTRLRSFELDGKFEPHYLALNLWKLLEPLAHLPHLQTFIIAVDLLNEDRYPTKMLTFPRLVHFEIKSDWGHWGTYKGLAAFSMPCLERIHLSPYGWSDDAVVLFNRNAPRLKRMDIEHGYSFSTTYSIIKAIVRLDWPHLLHLNIDEAHLMNSPLQAQEATCMEMLRFACPRARIHLMVKGACRVYYGVKATLDARLTDKEHACVYYR